MTPSEPQASVTFFANALIRRPVTTIVNSIQTGNLRVVPIFAMDFSEGNISFEDGMNMHDLKHKSNEYLDTLGMVAASYSNVMNLGIFGYGASTSAVAPQATSMFPLTRRIRNPFVPNDMAMIKEIYNDALSVLEMGSPTHLNSILMFFKALGTHCRASLLKRSKQTPNVKLSADSFYVLYILSSGLIEDID
jgi:hypothetical protein